MKLSILDQSHIPKGATAKEALQNTVQLAALAEKCGYTRFWVSEHHNMKQVAGSAPEILLAHLAAHTKSIRLGSGGVMLPHYSAYKVAETFRMLEALAPGRIDLGMGRAPGGDRITASLLNPYNDFRAENFVQQLVDLQNYLNEVPGMVSDHPPVKTTPIIDTVPEQWLLSSSGESAKLAGKLGMAFGFAHFINPFRGPEAVKAYKESFVPSANRTEPEGLVAIFMFCSKDKEKNRQVQAIWENRFLMLETRGRLDPVTYEDIKDVEYTPAEQQRLQIIRERFVIGTPEEVKRKFTGLAELYDVDEVMAVNAGIAFDERLESYQLLAREFNLV